VKTQFSAWTYPC